MDSQHSSTDPFVIGTLYERIYWREGSLRHRLRTVEKRARKRAEMHVNYIDPGLEAAVADLAKAVRKAFR